MQCEHPDRRPRDLNPLGSAAGLTATFFVIELFGGWWTGSLALIADAMHMGVDLIALLLSLWAARVARRPPDSRRTFGYRRVEVLAALGNGMWLLVATGVILREAYGRFLAPRPVLAGPMLAIASAGFACNLASGIILYGASKRDLNVRGAFLHVAADLLGSMGAMAAALVIMRTGWTRADPAASALVCACIVMASYWLVRDSVGILLESAPPHLDIEEIRSALSGIPGVREVHDLHLWSLAAGSESLSGHLVVADREHPARARAMRLPDSRLWPAWLLPAALGLASRRLPFHLVELGADTGLDLIADCLQRPLLVSETGDALPGPDEYRRSPLPVLSRLGLGPDATGLADPAKRLGFLQAAGRSWPLALETYEALAREPSGPRLETCPLLEAVDRAARIRRRPEEGMVLFSLGPTGALPDSERAALASRMRGLLATWGDDALWAELLPAPGGRELRVWRALGGELRSAFLGRVPDDAEFFMVARGWDFLQPQEPPRRPRVTVDPGPGAR